MIGSCPSSGTGNFDVILDEEYMMELLKDSARKKNKIEMDDIIEVNDEINQDEDINEDDIGFSFKLDKPDECYKVDKQEIKII
jgi:hypothetical protein